MHEKKDVYVVAHTHAHMYKREQTYPVDGRIYVSFRFLGLEQSSQKIAAKRTDAAATVVWILTGHPQRQALWRVFWA
jgi:hypothetical protein